MRKAFSLKYLTGPTLLTRALMTHLPGHTKAVLASGFFIGMRKGEILGLTWDKVDLKGRVIKLEAKDIKDKEPRTIPIPDELLEIFKVLPRALHDNHVFLFRGKPFGRITAGLRRACKDAGILYGRGRLRHHVSDQGHSRE